MYRTLALQNKQTTEVRVKNCVRIVVNSVQRLRIYLFHRVREVEDIEQPVRPNNTRDPTEEPSASESSPPFRSLELISRLGTPRQCQARCFRRLTLLEGGDSVDRQAKSKNSDKSCSSEGTRFPTHSGVAERASEDKGTDEEVSVGKTDLDSTQERRNGGSVSGKVGEVPRYQRTARHWRLESADEGVAVEWLDHLVFLRSHSPDHQWSRLEGGDG